MNTTQNTKRQNPYEPKLCW